VEIAPKLIGVNNRNLLDFTVDLQTTARFGRISPPASRLSPKAVFMGLMTFRV